MAQAVSFPPVRSTGRLAVLVPGMGSVATTLFAGVEAVKRKLALPVGSLTQLGEIAEEDGRSGPRLAEALPLAGLEELRFGGWDPIADDAYQAALRARVLDPTVLARLRPALEAIRPMPALFDPRWVRRLDGPNVKRGSLRARAEALRDDIRGFVEEQGCSRAVMLWAASTETFTEVKPAHRSLRAFEAALDRGDPELAPSMLYAWAALCCGVPFVNGAPNLAADVPALQELAEREGVPTAGKDFKTGQTLLKTAIAPALRARLLGLDGWFSTNILGNRDGEVLDDEAAFRTKQVSKLSVLEQILDPREHPELYGHVEHKVSIHYYRPRGDNKEGWDAIDLFGWMGLPMHIKIDFECRDSILAAPVALDLVLLTDLARRAGEAGPLEWLSFFFKSPLTAAGREPVHDLFRQHAALHRRLRRLAAARVTAPESAVG